MINFKFIFRSLVFLAAFFEPSVSFSKNVLNQLKIKNSSSFVINFTAPITQDQISTQFLNDIIQFTFKGVSIYPAKIIPVEKGAVSKVFVYQYTPEVVRCRFSIRGNPEEFKEKISITYSGKSINIFFNNKNFKKKYNQENELEKKESLSQIQKISTNEKKLDLVQTKVFDLENNKINSSDSLSLFWKTMRKLGFVIFLLLIFSFGIKILKNSQAGNTRDVVSVVKKFARGALFQDKKLIQVLSTHYLDQKKSISVVKVSGRLLVLGVAAESINLITQISDDSLLDEFEESLDASFYSNNVFLKEKNILDLNKNKSPYTGEARSRIKNRLEGLKPL